MSIGGWTAFRSNLVYTSGDDDFAAVVGHWEDILNGLPCFRFPYIIENNKVSAEHKWKNEFIDHVETRGLRQCGGDWDLRPSGVAFGRRLGIGSTGEFVGSWHKELGFH